MQCGVHTLTNTTGPQDGSLRQWVVWRPHMPPMLQGLTFSEATQHFFAVEEVYDHGEAAG